MAELRSFIFLDQLQPQTMCYLATWIKGSLPRADMAAQIIEVAPGLDIEPLTDVALKNTDVRGSMSSPGATSMICAAMSALGRLPLIQVAK